MLEVCIVLPVLLFLALGMVEFGQYFYIENIVESAARDACRATIPATAAAADPTTAVTRTLAQANITFTPSMMTITDDATGQTVSDVSTIFAGDAVSVNLQITYSQIPHVYRPFNDMTGHGISNNKTLHTVCTMIKE